jgi:peptidylprolyl isomerase
MKSMLQFILAAACAVGLVACGGGDKTPVAVVVPQPDYKLIETKVGTGDLVAASGDTVTIKYNGYMYDAAATANGNRGTKVRSTYDANTTFTYTVGVGAGSWTAGVGPGWDLALVGMRAGGTRTAILPANLALGSTAYAETTINGIKYPAIPANTPLVFDFEMVSITKAVIIPNTPPPTVTTFTDVVVGTGASVVTGSAVTVRYTGWLYDGTRANFKGTQFDTNTTTGKDPLAVTVGTGVVVGFSKGLVGMQVGGKRTVIIPSTEGYGTTGSGTTIPANAALVFDIEVLTLK